MNDSYLQQNLPRFIEELKQWLAIPSISADPVHAPDVLKAAEWAAAQLNTLGMASVEVVRTATHSLVLAKTPYDPSKPSLLFYGHFDVQPADPLEEWITPPFEATVAHGSIYARGAADDKGQVMVFFKALELLKNENAGYPVNITVLLEGEEETTGEAVKAFVTNNAESLKTDAVLICDTHMFDEQNPVLMTGLRGMLYTELTVSGAATDLHSGLYGGVAPNPLHALSHIIAALKAADGSITIQGLEGLLPPNPEAEETFWKDDPLNLAENFKTEMGVSQLVGPQNIPPLKRVMAGFTLEVHGIRGGFVGEGAKTVIPASATAKISLRLPGGVKPEDVRPLLENAIQSATPAGHTSSLKVLAEGEGLVVNPNSPAIQAAADALQTVYGHPTRYVRSGGSIPIATLFSHVLKQPVVLMGFGLPDDRLHAPNEKFSLKQFENGIRTVATFLKNLGGQAHG